jgi:fumarate reductase flavoprotein subunit
VKTPPPRLAIKNTGTARNLPGSPFAQGTKRMFVKWPAAALVLFLAFCGCQTEPSEEPGRTVDVVVAGSGIAGCMAALGAKEAGASRVLVIEKSSTFGINTKRSSGTLNPELVNARNNPEGSLANWKNIMGNSSEDTGFPDYDKWLEIAAQTGGRVDYLRSLGLHITANEVMGGGSALVEKMEESLKAKNIEVLLGCTANEIIMENGAAAGLRAFYKRNSFYIKAKSVILATGGFSQNSELVALWAGNKSGLHYVLSMADMGSSGDGILMAERAGGALYPNTFSKLAGLQFSPALRSISVFAQPTLYSVSPLPLNTQILVNNEAKRFMNEAIGGSANISAANYRAAYFMVTDSRPPYFIIYDSNNAPVGLYDITAILDSGAALQTGDAVKAASWEELAVKMQVDKNALQATVDTYNDFVDRGADDTADGGFGKDLSHLKRMATAPFYAVKVYPNSYGSMGGVVTDSSGRVLNLYGPNGRAIPRLYAAGEISNRDFFNQTYTGGASLALYSTTGWLAGKAAAN